MNWQQWYDSLNKPAWTPSGDVIGIIWSILYPIIFVVNGYVIWAVIKKQQPAILLLPLLINLAANILFTPLQFGLQNLWLATFDIVIVLLTTIWSIVVLYPRIRWAALAYIPYLLWVATATVLQISITAMNR